jgi:hypothetical protein
MQEPLESQNPIGSSLSTAQLPEVMAATRRGETLNPETAQVAEPSDCTGQKNLAAEPNDVWFAAIIYGFGAQVFYLSQCSSFWLTNGTWQCEAAHQVIPIVNNSIRSLTAVAVISFIPVVMQLAGLAGGRLRKYVSRSGVSPGGGSQAHQRCADCRENLSRRWRAPGP